MADAWLDAAITRFGAECAAKLSDNVGQPEAALRGPVEHLLTSIGQSLELRVVTHDEAGLADNGARPDFAVRVEGMVTGHVELKRPGTDLDPARFTGHNRRQWDRLKDLPNLLYTNGTDWRLYRHGELALTVSLSGDLPTADQTLAVVDLQTEALFRHFLGWNPPPIVSADRLVETVAPLCRLLRSSVLEQLSAETRAVEGGAEPDDQPFSVLARSWRNLLFPTATDEVFADGYAQTLTFALLLARTHGIDVATLHPARIAQELGRHSAHSLMGQALKMLSESAIDSFRVTLDLLRRVVGAVQWEPIWANRDDAYLHLYESFLTVYDPALRKASGSYYTPVDVVDAMVRLTEEVLTTRLGLDEGYLSPGVTTVDPAMGTGTFLHSVIDRTARRAAETDGPGAAGAAVSALVQRLVGFELQMGPYTVAEMRAADLLAGHDAAPPEGGLRLHVTNTLDDPYEEAVALPGLTALSRSHKQANRIKADTPVTVVIGNPPYRERAEDKGGWVENGSANTQTAPPLDLFRAEGNGKYEYVLKNLYIYFWAWAAWKVFEAHASDRHGVVCFITTSGYLKGPGFAGMRRYLRRTCSEGWIINVSPEGLRPDVPTRIFPGVQHPLAIGIFLRRTDTADTTPAAIRYTHLTGRREDKYAQLRRLSLDGDQWQRVRDGWDAPFLPAAESGWDAYPALNDLFCWMAPGTKPNRTWVYAPHPDTLHQRWDTLVAEDDAEHKRALFKESDSRRIDTHVEALPGQPPHSVPIGRERGPCPRPKRIAYRTFDRQWVIPDNRLIHRPSPDLWAAELAAGQLFLSEQHSQPISSGPAVAFTTLIPDMHHFNVRGGRVLPLLHPDGSPNLAPGLLEHLSDTLETPVSATDVCAYIAGVTCHPAFTRRFAGELVTPGIRLPLTTDRTVWQKAIELGREFIWSCTYGQACADENADRPRGDITFAAGDPRRPRNLTAVGADLPDTVDFIEDADTEGRIQVGQGAFGPVTRQMWDYDVGGMHVIRQWLSYRTARRNGRRSSPLDDITPTAWPREWITEFNELLTALRRVTDLEGAQAELLDEVLAGPMITLDQLRAAGAKIPDSSKERKPRHSLTSRDMSSSASQDSLL